MEITRREPFGSSPTVGSRGSSTYRRILEASLEVFAKHGYDGAQVELITEAAGCSRPAFYQYFSSKSDVYWRLAGELSDAMIRLSKQMGVSTPNAAGVEQLVQWFDGIFEIYDSYQPMFSAYSIAAREGSERIAASRIVSMRIGKRLVPNLKDVSEPVQREIEQLILPIVLSGVYYWELIYPDLPRERYMEAAAMTLHRLQHGVIAGVNAPDLVGVAPAASSPMPDFEAQIFGSNISARGRETRKLLLTAGAQTLSAKGYHDTRIDDVVAEAGVSHGTFYRHFESKERFFDALTVVAMGSVVELIERVPNDTDDASLHAWVHEWLLNYLRNGGVLSAWSEIESPGPKRHRYGSNVAIGMVERIQRVLDQREFGDTQADALLMLGALERGPYMAGHYGGSAPEITVGALLVFLKRGLLGREI